MALEELWDWRGRYCGCGSDEWWEEKPALLWVVEGVERSGAEEWASVVGFWLRSEAVRMTSERWEWFSVVNGDIIEDIDWCCGFVVVKGLQSKGYPYDEGCADIGKTFWVYRTNTLQ